MEQDEIIKQFILGIKSNNIRYEWMIKFYPSIKEKMENEVSLKEIFEALNKEQMIDKSFSFSSFRKYFYAIKTKTEPSQKNKQTKNKNRTTKAKIDNKTEDKNQTTTEIKTNSEISRTEKKQFEMLDRIKNELVVKRCYMNQEAKDCCRC